MKKLLEKIRRILRNRRIRRLLTRVVSITAALVVFVTTYALVLPAITMETNALCGKEAHEHTDDCYIEELICGLEESPGHRHDESCYEVSQVQVCQAEEHQHDQSCYDDEGNLTCKLEEHEHSDECFEEHKELICDIPESEGHTHTAECYQKILDCGKEVHIHSAECYEQEEYTDSTDDSEDVYEIQGYSDDMTTDEADGMEEDFEEDSEDDFAEDDQDSEYDPEDEEGFGEDGYTDSGTDDYEDGSSSQDNADQAETDGMMTDEADDEAGDFSEAGEEDGDFSAAGEEDGDFSEAGEEDGDFSAAGDEDGYSSDDDGENIYKETGEEDGEESGQEATGKTADDTDEDAEGVSSERAEAGTDETEKAAQGDAESADGASADAKAAKKAENSYVPELDPVDFEAVLNRSTGIYYYHVSEDETIENSSSVTDWNRVDENTELGKNDLLRVYLSYTIPPGSLNETNPTARCRLPENIRLSDAQIEEINKSGNGIAAAYSDLEEEYQKYLGMEAVEGVRKPDEKPEDDAQEFISATVRAADVYDEEGQAGEAGAYLGQDLIFTFVPYTIEKNRNTYDAEHNIVSAGEEITGWFVCDLNTDQVEWSDETIIRDDQGTFEDIREKNDNEQGAPEDIREKNDNEQGAPEDIREKNDNEQEAPEDIQENSDTIQENGQGAPEEGGNNTGDDPDDGQTGKMTVTAEKTADIIFVAENKEEDIEEISCRLRLVDQMEADRNLGQDTDPTGENEEDAAAGAEDASGTAAENEKSQDSADAGKDAADDRAAAEKDDVKTTEADKDQQEKGGQTFKAGRLTAEGNGYRITLDYTEEAEIPDNAELAVREITAETDKEAYEQCLAQTKAHVEKDAEEKAEVDTNMTRFFDIEILAKSEESDENAAGANGKMRKIEPAAPVQVSILILDKPAADSEQTLRSDPTVLHFAEEGVEQIDATATTEETVTESGGKGEDSGNRADKDADLARESEKESEKDSGEESGKKTGEESRNASDGSEPETRSSASSDPAPEGSTATEVQFEAESFSIYGVVYTVDFSYSVNGKTYEFSLPGGGFVSFTDLVEVLGITGDKNSAENAAKNGSENDTEADDNDTEADTKDTEAAPLTLGDVEVSEAARKFVADVDSVKFSSPDLVWVGKAEDDSTVGGLKEVNELECQYSVELTEDQINKINGQTVEAGDWALISMQPFTSEERLTVTMKNGEQFVVKVTDGQISTHVITADGKDFVITVTYGEDAQIPEDARLEADEILPGTDDYEEYISRTWKTLSKVRKSDNDVDQPEENNLDEPGSEEPGGQGVEETEEIGVTFARFFDIRIMAGDEKIEPSAPVKVTVTYTDPIESLKDGNVFAIHFAEEGIEVIDASADEEAKEVVFTQDSFSVTGTIVTNEDKWPSSNGKYLMYVKSGDNYYAVAHDGSLTPVTISNGKIMIGLAKPIIDSDYLWSYEKQQDLQGRSNYFVYYNNGSNDVYLDPRNSNGLNTNVASYSMPTLTRENEGLIRYSGYGSSGQYIGVNNEFISGTQPQSNAVPVQFASMPLTVTVHFVDRGGNPITGITYRGDSSYPITENSDGTYTIPYNWEGTSGTVDLKNDFYKNGYTYGSSHLAGTRDRVDYTFDGVTIDANLIERNNKLYFKSDCGDQYANPRGNLGYNPLPEYNINGAFSVPKEAVNTTTNVGTTNYSHADVDKDIYVILDPVPSSTSGGGNNNIGVPDPVFDKKLESNGDGTYTLSLSVTGSAKNAQANPKANVVFIVDTSSSMRKNVSNPNSNNSPTRLEDTKKEAAKFAETLLSNNTPGENSDRIELSMITFDGTAVSSGEWYKTYNGSDGFETEINKLIPDNMHTGTDWEDALKEAYRLGNAKKVDGDATYVIFFTDGEPSQYTNFNGTGEYTGLNRGYRYWYSCFLSRETAKDEARAIINSGMQLYSIFAYNPISDTYAATGENGSTLLYNTTAYAYNTASYENEGDNILEGSRFFLAQTTNQLNTAFASILNSINEYVGVTDVKVNDSITSLTSVGITGNNGGFKYTRSGGRYGTAEQTWEEAPLATYDSNGVHWNLGSAVLEDGVTYKVSFVVWPSQQAYDYVAKLNNGLIEFESIPANLRSHFLRVEDSSKPSGYRYEVATNPPSTDDEGHIINNLITYTKTHRETVGNLPSGVTVNDPVEETDLITGTKTTTTYIRNTDGTTYTKIVVTEKRDAFGPPDLNMGLDNNFFKVQKKWVVSRPYELVNFLYNTYTGDPIEDNKNIDFTIKQDTNTTYTTITLGYDAGEDPDDPDDDVGFVWADEPQTVTLYEGTENERDFEIGTIWEKPLDIPFGLMLTPENAAERNLDITDPKYIPVYSTEEDARNNVNVLYYVLEKGHDFNIVEPSLDYRFDFTSEPLHPMLLSDQVEDVRPDPRDVKLEYKTIGGRERAILKYLSPDDEDISALTGQNILRGELKIKKTVLDENGNVDTSEGAMARVFPLTVTLTNDDAPFYNIQGNPHEQNVPWYGIQGDDKEHTLYYHKVNADGSFAYYCNELEACVEGDYTNGVKNGYKGNIMSESQNHKTASATIYVYPKQIWTITNIPGGTTYKIEEDTDVITGYVFVRAEETDSSPANVTEGGTAEISGTIQSNHVTNVEFTNQKRILPINITIVKTDVNQLNDTDPVHLPNAVFRLEKYTTNTYQELDESWASEGRMILSDTNGTGTFSIPAVPEGFYKLVETEFPAGYVMTSGPPIFEVRENIAAGILEIFLLEKKTDGTVSDVDGNNDGVVRIENLSVTVGNTPGMALPSTGGSGTRLFTILGSILILGAGVLLWRRRRLI